MRTLTKWEPAAECTWTWRVEHEGERIECFIGTGYDERTGPCVVVHTNDERPVLIPTDIIQYIVAAGLLAVDDYATNPDTWEEETTE
jgi:hypothetical protein